MTDSERISRLERAVEALILTVIADTERMLDLLHSTNRVLDLLREEPPPPPIKSPPLKPPPVRSGRVRSGRARMAMLTPEERRAFARKGAVSRWEKTRKE